MAKGFEENMGFEETGSSIRPRRTIGGRTFLIVMNVVAWFASC